MLSRLSWLFCILFCIILIGRTKFTMLRCLFCLCRAAEIFALLIFMFICHDNENVYYFIIFIFKGQINTQGAIITHLKEQVEKFRDYKEQVVVLQIEREHLENKVKTLTEKVKYLSTPVREKYF